MWLQRLSEQISDISVRELAGWLLVLLLALVRLLYSVTGKPRDLKIEIKGKEIIHIIVRGRKKHIITRVTEGSTIPKKVNHT
jgi:hypothetical protein